MEPVIVMAMGGDSKGLEATFPGTVGKAAMIITGALVIRLNPRPLQSQLHKAQQKVIGEAGESAQP